MRRPFAAVVAILAALALAPAGAVAAEWPAKPVRIVVPFAAGGSADTFGRLYAEALAAAFGRPFYVENRLGGGGLIGTEAVARAEPDGLTLMVSGIPTHVLGPAMNKNVGFDPMRDFTHIGYFGGTPNALVVHPSLALSSYRDFVALARRADGTQYVSAGFGTMGNWVAEYLAAKESIRLTHVAYKGGAQALLDLLAGHVKVGMLTWSTVAEHAARAADRVRGHLGAAAAGCARAADVPGARPRRLRRHRLVFAVGPAGLAPDVVAGVNREIVRAVERPQVKRQSSRTRSRARR